MFDDIIWQLSKLEDSDQNIPVPTSLSPVAREDRSASKDGSDALLLDDDVTMSHESQGEWNQMDCQIN
jgi:hypothetical protein